MQRRSEELQLAVQEYLDVDWTSVKYYLRRQIAKCVQECKSQASNAKRIARTIKHKQNNSGTLDTNGAYESDEDSDDWGSDFEDESDYEEKNESHSCELNNNTIIQPACEPSEEISTTCISSEEVSPKKFIPKPPDVPVIPSVANGPVIRKTYNHSNTIPRPPVKRPPSQPPPPPVAQVSSPDFEQEDYEIPIVSTASASKENSEHSDSSLSNVISNEFAAETYELIEPPEETYEIVDAHNSPTNVVEKPLLPPRIPLSSSVSPPPPPLPQKPKKLIDNAALHEKPEGVKTFTRPKPLPKADGESEPFQSSSISNIGFIGSLMGRRSSSTPPSSSPKILHKSPNDSSLNSVVSPSESLSSLSSSPDKDALLTVGRSSFLITGSTTSDVKKLSPLPPLPPRGTPSVSEETAQNMATRPLPPVPTPKEEKPANFPQEAMQSYPWYHEIERQKAEEVVKSLNESGSFVVRPSKRAGIENPYSLTILHDDKLFHLNIRHRPDKTFALGKEKKKEKTFLNVADLIAFHQTEPILLTSRGEPAGKTILSKYPQKT